MLRLLGLFGFLVVVSHAIAAPPAPLSPAPDPAAAVARAGGDWLSFLHVDPRVLSDRQRRSLIDILDAILRTSQLSPWTGGPIVDPIYERSLSLARQGHPVAVWALPHTGDRQPDQHIDQAILALRVWDRARAATDVVKDLKFIGSPAGAPPADWQDALAAGATAPSATTSPISVEAVGEWPRHREAATALNPTGLPVVLELAINVNACRQAYGADFDAGRGALMLETARLANARVIGIHAWILPAAQVALRDPSLPWVAGGVDDRYHGPDLLCVAVSWSARSQTPGTVRARMCTTPFWPRQQLGSPPSPDTAALAAAARTPWRAMIPAWLEIYGASLTVADREAFVTARNAWAREYGPAADRLALNLAPYLGAAIQPTEEHTVIRWHSPLKSDAAPSSIAPIVTRVFSSVQASLKGDPGGGVVEFVPFATERWKHWSGALGLDVPQPVEPGQPKSSDAASAALRGEWRIKPRSR